MTWTYLLLDVLAILGPLALSFDKRVHYFSKWKYVIFASLIVAVPFLIWDYFFTSHGVWGFNENYISVVQIAGLPLEEIAFFIVVPFSCTFIYECCKYYLHNWKNRQFDVVLRSALFAYIAILVVLNPTGLYTIVNALLGIVVLSVWFFKKDFRHVGITFVISLIPFLIMNGILTGAITESPVVWYNDLENVSLRIHTIPMEDVIYGMSLILSVIFLYETLLKRSQSNSSRT